MNMKATVHELVVPELVKLARRTKKRINRKTMPNQEWAPRGVYGTHLGKNPNPEWNPKGPTTPATDGLTGGANRGTGDGLDVVVSGPMLDAVPRHRDIC